MSSRVKLVASSQWSEAVVSRNAKTEAGRVVLIPKTARIMKLMSSKITFDPERPMVVIGSDEAPEYGCNDEHRQPYPGTSLPTAF